MFGVKMEDRGRMMDEKLGILRRIFDGETFEHGGRRIQVTPQPVQEGGPRLFIGGGVRATAQRAAKYGDGYYPMALRPDFIEEYHRLCAERGKMGRVIDGNGSTVIHIAEDPDADWARMAEYALHETNSYALNAKAFGQPLPYQPVDSPEALRRSGNYLVLTPEEGLAYCREQRKLGRYVAVNPLLSGIDPDSSWRSLEMIADRIIPELRQDETLGC